MIHLKQLPKLQNQLNNTMKDSKLLKEQHALTKLIKKIKILLKISVIMITTKMAK